VTIALSKTRTSIRGVASQEPGPVHPAPEGGGYTTDGPPLRRSGWQQTALVVPTECVRSPEGAASPNSPALQGRDLFRAEFSKGRVLQTLRNIDY
jgi:hypothetical protein